MIPEIQASLEVVRTWKWGEKDKRFIHGKVIQGTDIPVSLRSDRWSLLLTRTAHTGLTRNLASDWHAMIDCNKTLNSLLSWHNRFPDCYSLMLLLIIIALPFFFLFLLCILMSIAVNMQDFFFVLPSQVCKRGEGTYDEETSLKVHYVVNQEGKIFMTRQTK